MQLCYNSLLAHIKIGYYRMKIMTKPKEYILMTRIQYSEIVVLWCYYCLVVAVSAALQTSFFQNHSKHHFLFTIGFSFLKPLRALFYRSLSYFLKYQWNQSLGPKKFICAYRLSFKNALYWDRTSQKLTENTVLYK